MMTQYEQAGTCIVGGLKIEKITFSNRLIVIIMVYHICFRKIKVIFDFEGFQLGCSRLLKSATPFITQKKVVPFIGFMLL